MSERHGARPALAGRYELAEVIGRGGMGTVYRADDLVLGRSVAVKTLHGLIADENPNSVARFEREARAAASLNHPAVVAIYDTGVDASAHFIVMELVAGRSLEAILREDGALEPERAVAIASQVADALAAAHRAGIIHRDVKPANVMVAEDGSVKVLDFGIARAMGVATLTETASVLGTAAYMAPEQALGKPVDERSDIYALGCVLYALLAGHPPFTGESFAAIMHQQANVTPRPPRAENRRVPPALSALVMEMLAKSPEDRPRSATEVRNRLTALSRRPPIVPVATRPSARVRSSAPTKRVPPAAAGGSPPAAAGGSPPAAARALSPAARRLAPAPPAPPLVTERWARRRLAVAGALVAVILVIGLVALASGQSSPRSVAIARHGAAASAAAVARKRSATRSAPSTATTVARTASAPAAPAPPAGHATAAASGAAGHPHSVVAAARALAALISQDVQSGAIDPQAWHQLAPALVGVLDSWRTGGVVSVEHQLADAAQQVAVLEQQGHIASAAAPGLGGALAELRSALSAASPQSPTEGGVAPPGDGGSAGQGAGPPGHRGVPPDKGGGPPGHDKHFGAQDGSAQGN